MESKAITLCLFCHVVVVVGISDSIFNTFPLDIQQSIKNHVPELIEKLEPTEIRHLVKLIHAKNDVQRLRILTRTNKLYKKIVQYTVESLDYVRNYKQNTKNVLEKVLLVLPELVLRPSRLETRTLLLTTLREYKQLSTTSKEHVKELFPHLELLGKDLNGRTFVSALRTK